MNTNKGNTVKGTATTVRAKAFKLMGEVFQSAVRQIESHRQRASDRAGREIEWEIAERAWLQHFFPHWKQRQWQESVEAALRSLDGPPLATVEEREKHFTPRSTRDGEGIFSLPHGTTVIFSARHMEQEATARS